MYHVNADSTNYVYIRPVTWPCVPQVNVACEPSSGWLAWQSHWENAWGPCQCTGTREPSISLSFDHVCTNHSTMLQPRSSIYAMFDDLLLLSEGSCLYSGTAARQGLHIQHAWPLPALTLTI